MFLNLSYFVHPLTIPSSATNIPNSSTEVTEMSGFGRGRGGGRGGMLKGATWDYDPEAKVESAPSDLFPVSLLPLQSDSANLFLYRNTPI